MRRAILLAALILACTVSKAQNSDATLLRRVSFDSPVPAADSLGTEGSSDSLIGRQLSGTCPFIPDHRAFFRSAVRKAGFIPAVVFTLDRLTRSGRVGTSQHHRFSEDGFIHEGVEAYLPDKRKEP